MIFLIYDSDLQVGKLLQTKEEMEMRRMVISVLLIIAMMTTMAMPALAATVSFDCTVDGCTSTISYEYCGDYRGTSEYWYHENGSDDCMWYYVYYWTDYVCTKCGNEVKKQARHIHKEHHGSCGQTEILCTLR